MDFCCRRISVNEIINYLYYNDTNFYYKNFKNSNHQKKENNNSKNGSVVHRMLGFENFYYVFSKLIEVEVENNTKEYWIVTGTPDEINIEEGYIGELKTYKDPNKKDFLIEVAITQGNIYCYLSGFKKFVVYIYSIPEEKFVYKEFFEANYNKALEDIKRGIYKKRELCKIAQETFNQKTY